MTRRSTNKEFDLPLRLFRDQAAFDAWLGKNAGTSNGLWLRIAKKTSKLSSATYAEALEAALCHGWIDGQRRSYDDDSFVQRFTPRGPRSMWSKINRTKATELIEAGRMRPTGLAAIDRAKENGNWDAAYDSYSTAEVPPDLAKALGRNRRARAFFETLNKQNRFAILYRIQTARKPETRARRIEQFVEMLGKGQRLHPG